MPQVFKQHFGYKTPVCRIISSISSWWLNQPIWKICSSKWVHLPQIFGVKNKNCLSCHHLDLFCVVRGLILHSNIMTRSWPSSEATGILIFADQKSPLSNNTNLGGWTNPFGKYARRIGSSPQVRFKIRNVWNHHLGIHLQKGTQREFHVGEW